jgi:hypothetical protein
MTSVIANIGNKQFEKQFVQISTINPKAERVFYKKFSYEVKNTDSKQSLSNVVTNATGMTIATTNATDEQLFVKPKTGNGLFDMFFHAYNCHGNVQIRPDDFYVAFMCIMTNYINLDPSKHRKKLVGESTKDRIDIEVEAFPDFEQVINTYMREFDQQFLEEITSNFSTSTVVDKFISKCCVMDAAKQIMPMVLYTRCGINAFKFLGKNEDWLLLITQTQTIANRFGGVFQQYYEKTLLPILKKLADIQNTLESKENLKEEQKDYLQNVFVKAPARSGKKLDFTGWLANFFPDVQDMEPANTYDSISKSYVQVPVVWNRLGKVVNLTFEAGILGNIISNETFSCVHGLQVYEKETDEFEISAEKICKSTRIYETTSIHKNIYEFEDAFNNSNVYNSNVYNSNAYNNSFEY